MSGRARPMPGAWLSPGQAAGALVGPAQFACAWRQFAGRKVALTQSGRTAIAMLREALGLARGDEVLLPAYHCGTEVDALLAGGLTVRCVDTDERGMLDADALERAATDRTRAVYVIHPFGWAQDLDAIDTWRRERGLLLVEDCALALFGDDARGEPLGTRADASVFSFPKSLPTPDGGALTWTTAWEGPGPLRRPAARRTARRLAGLVKAWGTRRFGRARDAAEAPRVDDPGPPRIETGDMPASYYFEAWRDRRAPSRATERLLKRVHPDQVCAQRRANWAQVSAAARDGGFSLMFDALPPGICPLFCPVIAPAREGWVRWLSAAGVETSPWWSGGHRSIDWSMFPVAARLKETVLPLPVHQGLTAPDMSRLAELVGRRVRVDAHPVAWQGAS
ncbi:MAG: DegT/DnrJ/EryC1/StrS family aminotransferase [Phycisphaerales bacterium]